VALALAAPFADRERVVLSKCARLGDGWTEPQPIRLTRARGATFTGPTAVLISGSTASAAEVFSMVMRELPHVTLVGSRTQGIISDELEKRLPNGWRFTLSNERYSTPDRSCFEGIGVPPDVEVIPRLGEGLAAYLRRGLKTACDVVAGSAVGRR
jgi:C-terminal processing protease CtpA/Prc